MHLAVHTDNSNLLSIVLQYGADVNSLDANGYIPLIISNKKMVNDRVDINLAKILLEWGAEIILPRDIMLTVQTLQQKKIVKHL